MIVQQEFILKARTHFANLSMKCIEEAKSGSVKVNDLDAYVAWNERQITESLEGKWDHTFTHLQYAYYLQTGESIALLP